MVYEPPSGRRRASDFEPPGSRRDFNQTQQRRSSNPEVPPLLFKERSLLPRARSTVYGEHGAISPVVSRVADQRQLRLKASPPPRMGTASPAARVGSPPPPKSDALAAAYADACAPFSFLANMFVDEL